MRPASGDERDSRLLFSKINCFSIAVLCSKTKGGASETAAIFSRLAKQRCASQLLRMSTWHWRRFVFLRARVRFAHQRARIRRAFVPSVRPLQLGKSEYQAVKRKHGWPNKQQFDGALIAGFATAVGARQEQLQQADRDERAVSLRTGGWPTRKATFPPIFNKITADRRRA